MEEHEYWRAYSLIRADVQAAIDCSHTFLTINNLVVTDQELGQKLNRFAGFWILNRFALQTTFFIAFGRLFDTRRDALSVPKLVDKTISNPGLFAKTALRERMLKNSQPGSASLPNWPDENVQRAWEPRAASL